MNPTAPNNPQKETPSPGTRTVLASVAAIASVLVASSCCLPVLPFVFAAGVAGSSAFLTTLRPYLLAFSVVMVGYGFYHGWRANKCRSRRGSLTTLLLWASALFVVASIFFPEVLANTVATLMAR
jgi:cytochrome bd-type quinol oxidase subunit 2